VVDDSQHADDGDASAYARVEALPSQHGGTLRAVVPVRGTEDRSSRKVVGGFRDPERRGHEPAVEGAGTAHGDAVEVDALARCGE
jgi:hypothetical protein